ncbi:archaea-specific SMC-related protein [Halovivax gelatinilyticus]|uniref:archaea-specific SMC-related protein n=1 Tax=Halovivax gelatinilyticus TaxID=2961597 RepID=UPI0020CA40B0|nr:archaea-specific SMC-related protein [Halovivax gelatinilyticus]
MDQQSPVADRVEVDVENVGGIDETRVEFSPGITVLTGRNATNRTSFLRSLMAVLGSDEYSLKSDADSGRVELSIGDETFTRTLERTNATVTSGGEPYLDDPTLADLFAFLLESNEARRAVERGGDLRELIMRPVDTEAIHAEIDRLRERKASIRDELDELDELERERTRLESERTRLESDLETARDERDERERSLESYDRDVEETRSEKDELESALSELNEVRSELESVRFEIETQRESIETLREERESLGERLDEDGSVPAEELARIEGRLEALRERKAEVESLVTDVQRIVRFNEEVLSGDEGTVATLLRSDEDDPTDALVADEVVCWTCGSEVETDRIESTLDELRELRVETSATRRDLNAEIDEVSAEKRRLESERESIRDDSRRLDRIDAELDDREATVASLVDDRERLTERVRSLEAEVEELDVVDEYDEMLDRHRELNQAEFRIDQLEDELAETEREIDALDERLGERSTLESRLEDVSAELDSRRTEIERIEADAVSHFNEHMEEVLDILEYDNLDRIWIERTTTEKREGRRTVEASTFDLHIVRSTDADVAYEDTVDNLSESEREVTGLVFALAGYLVHDVYETLPFVLLDSLEAIDADRIARLVEYIGAYVDALVVALLPEDAAALSDEYERITEI